MCVNIAKIEPKWVDEHWCSHIAQDVLQKKINKKKYQNIRRND